MANDAGWLTPEVARAQRALVEKQLQNPMQVAPFRAFIEAINHIEIDYPSLVAEMSLLDIGCGVGHYSKILGKLYPHLFYYGTDSSPAMINEAIDFCGQNDHKKFRIYDFEDNVFDATQIVLISQAMEYLDDPWDGLDLALQKTSGILILHRLNLTDQESYRIESEPTYCGNTGKNYRWNLGEVFRQIAAWYRHVEWHTEWDNHATIVVGAK